MPTREEILKERTYKEDGIPTEKRVFYTLTHGSKPTTDLVALRNSKAIGSLIKTLLDAGALTEHQLDEILLDVSH